MISYANFYHAWAELHLAPRVGLPGVMKTKSGLDKCYGNFFIKIFLNKIFLYNVSYISTV